MLFSDRENPHLPTDSVILLDTVLLSLIHSSNTYLLSAYRMPHLDQEAYILVKDTDNEQKTVLCIRWYRAEKRHKVMWVKESDKGGLRKVRQGRPLLRWHPVREWRVDPCKYLGKWVLYRKKDKTPEDGSLHGMWVTPRKLKGEEWSKSGSLEMASETRQ